MWKVWDRHHAIFGSCPQQWTSLGYRCDNPHSANGWRRRANLSRISMCIVRELSDSDSYEWYVILFLRDLLIPLLRSQIRYMFPLLIIY